ncbi:hypothetical protein [Coralloluteibacterium thermophilus]|uniref:PepSY domain-containing protein n=1 Tax=Coralloluteibacterium thermophilum TaxID=2707049 RepID=A0ABV9NNN6_9GAMM
MTHTILKAAALSAAIAFAGFAHAQSAVDQVPPPVDTTPPTDPIDATSANPADPVADPAAAAASGPVVAGEAELETALNAAGYTNVSGLEQNGTIWNGEAVNPQGARVALRIDAQAGTVQEAALDTEEAE